MLYAVCIFYLFGNIFVYFIKFYKIIISVVNVGYLHFLTELC